MGKHQSLRTATEVIYDDPILTKHGSGTFGNSLPNETGDSKSPSFHKQEGLAN